MKKVTMIFWLLILAYNLFAQKNTFEFGVNKNFPKNDFEKQHKQKSNNYETPSSVSYEFRYSRKVSNNFSIFAQYARLPTNSLSYATVRYRLVEASIGKLTAHLKYNFFDLGTQYNVFQYQQHRFTVNIGISLAYGEDLYLVNAIWIYGPDYPEWGHFMFAEERREKAHYWGGVAGVKYDYLFWKNRINFGPEFSARYYTKGFPYQFSYGLHVGYNF